MVQFQKHRRKKPKRGFTAVGVGSSYQQALQLTAGG